MIYEMQSTGIWRGGLKDGEGAISTESGVLVQMQYFFGTRFDNGIATNPEEPIAAAHAGCFSMAFSAELGKIGITPESIHTLATVTLDNTNTGWTVTGLHLDVTAKIRGIDRAKLTAIANGAKAGCPIWRLLNTTITTDAKLEI
jgi:osmotically inducible protein OsmC